MGVFARLFGKSKPKVGRPTKSEAEAKAQAAARAAATARKQQLDDLRTQLELAQMQRQLKRLANDDDERQSEIEQMAATLEKLRAVGIIPKDKTPGEDGAATLELVKALAPYVPQMLAAIGALKHTGHLLQPPELAIATPQTDTSAQAPAPRQETERPPAFADAALSGALSKRTPQEAAEWLWGNQGRWGMVTGIVESLIALPDEQLPGYLDYLGQYFPRTVAWLRERPDFWRALVVELRRKIAA